MTDLTENTRAGNPLLQKRYRAERRFRAYGITAILIAIAVLGVMLVSIFGLGYTAFQQTEIKLDIYFDPAVIDPTGERDPTTLSTANYQTLARNALHDYFPDVTGRRDKRALNSLLSRGASNELREMVKEDPNIIGNRQTLWLPASDELDMLIKGQIDTSLPAAQRQISDQQIAWGLALQADGLAKRHFNHRFLTNGDSREPELAGIWGAMVGSFLALFVCFILSFPIGVMAAIYLEEFAPTNRLTDLIEVNINNLAAVPSIVFGLLGLAIFLNFMDLPRSAPLVGGMVLALMTLPTIIIAARAALKAVPPSIREAALGVGASPMQTVFHHVLPLGLPGMLTGAIIGMAQALGETAPLLMIGMVAFIVDIPQGVFDPATALPVQIFIWADSPERAFLAKTAAGIMVLLGFLIVMNLSAVLLRRHFTRRW